MPAWHNKGALDQAVTELKPSRRGVPTAQEGMVDKVVHGGLTTRAGGVIREHPHAQTIPEAGAVIEAIQSLLQA